MSSIWDAYLLGRDTTKNIVGVSYSNELSGKFARDCIALMQTQWYCELFPKAVISQRRLVAYEFETVASGGRLATSVTGTLTGRGGYLFIFDDVIKPDEAMSEPFRQGVNGWFQSTLSSRFNDKASGAIVLVMQRLHQDDLAGMLLETGVFEHLCLPAIALDDQSIPLTQSRTRYRSVGDVLHPERERVEVLERLKAQMGSIAFVAQYLQDPVSAEGNMILGE